MRDTERIRGLRFLRPVEVRIQDRKAMRAYVSAALEQEELERIRLRYVALGLLDASLDVRALIEALMEEELIGYYDPETQRLAVRDDVARAFARDPDDNAALEWRATVVHELVHALQDQHLGLRAALDLDRTTDADNALGALVEGDATLAMLAYAASLSGVSLDMLVQDRDALSKMLRSAPETLTGSMRKAPAIVRDPLLFRYRDGALFAAALIDVGGFRTVDEAHRAPPQSTREIQDPARFLAHEAQPTLSLPGLAILKAEGHRVIDEDTLGRFELSIYLGPQGHTLAASWLADRYVVFRRGEVLGSYWLIAFTSAAAAKRAAAAARQYYPAETVRIERSDAYVLIMREVSGSAQAPLIREFQAWVETREPLVRDSR